MSSVSFVSLSAKESNVELRPEEHRTVVVGGGELQERAHALLDLPLEDRPAVRDDLHGLPEIKLIRREQQRERRDAARRRSNGVGPFRQG